MGKSSVTRSGTAQKPGGSPGGKEGGQKRVGRRIRAYISRNARGRKTICHTGWDGEGSIVSGPEKRIFPRRNRIASDPDCN